MTTKKKSPLHLALFLAFSLLVARPVAAGKAALETLANSANRPTMEQVLNAAGGVPARNPLPSEPNTYRDPMSQLKDMPKVIAFMEKAFPGAIWAPLGRDAVIFGDLLDAFYLSIGQHGRVARLNASGNSFSGVSNAMRVKLMESAGLDLKNVRGSRPFVGLDRTGFSYQSQSTTLIRAGYEAYAAAGGNPADLIHRLNFLGLSSGEPGQGMDQDMIDRYFSELQVSTDTAGVAMISGIMQLEVGGWTDSAEWHGTFGALATGKGGKVEGPPGPPAPLEQRRNVLGEMISILQAVSKPEFIASVQLEARKLRFEFPISNLDIEKVIAERARAAEIAAAEQRKLAIERSSTYPEDMSARFKAVARKLPRRPEGAQTTYLTANAQKLSEWLDSELLEHAEIAEAAPDVMKDFKSHQVTLYFISEITTLRTRSLISSRDYRRLLARALSASQVDDDFLKYFGVVYKSEATLREALKEKAEFFLTTFKKNSRAGTENTEAVYRKIREVVMELPIDCQDVFADRAS